MKKYNLTYLSIYEVQEIAPALIPYFNYYASKYESELLGDSLIITIPYSDGSRSLDDYFINILTRNGWSYRSYDVLREIYLSKPLKAIKTA